MILGSGGTDNDGDTEAEYRAVIGQAQSLFLAKLGDYGPSWHIFRFSSVIDQIFIKAKRIRRLEELGGTGKVPDTIEQEYVGIVNYCVVALDKLLHGDSNDGRVCTKLPSRWVTPEHAKSSYDAIIDRAWHVLERKNHDYGEAWRDMEVTSLTDEILGRVARIKHMLRRGHAPTVSEHLDAQLFDTLNYAVLALIKLDHDSDDCLSPV